MKFSLLLALTLMVPSLNAQHSPQEDTPLPGAGSQPELPAQSGQFTPRDYPSDLRGSVDVYQIIDSVRTTLEAYLWQVHLPDRPIPSESVTRVVEDIVTVLNRISAYIARETQLRNMLPADLRMVRDSGNTPVDFGVHSLDTWLQRQGCVHKVSLPERSVWQPRLNVVLTTAPLQIPVEVGLAVSNGEIYFPNLSLFVDVQSNVRLLPMK
ncbi:MAG TPA: hypothetical protein VKA68_05220 [bacterium]|nr:hypothetical protein [bacterium]